MFFDSELVMVENSFLLVHFGNKQKLENKII